MEHNAISLISRIYAITQKWLADELAAAGLARLAPSHGDVLACLFRNGPTAMRDLAAFSHRTKATTTVLVDKLEEMGLVRREKSENYARSVVVALTDEGEALRRRFNSISRRLVKLVYSDLDKTEAETLERLLGKILADLKTQSERKDK